MTPTTGTRIQPITSAAGIRLNGLHPLASRPSWRDVFHTLAVLPGWHRFGPTSRSSILSDQLALICAILPLTQIPREDLGEPNFQRTNTSAVELATN
jgi:hypothetical protein